MNTKTVICGDCHGSGQQAKLCPICKGKGKREVVYHPEDIQAKLAIALAQLKVGRAE